MAQDYASERRGLEADAAARAAGGSGPRLVPTEALFNAGDRKLFIAHAGDTYTLQITRQNRLLLTK